MQVFISCRPLQQHASSTNFRPQTNGAEYLHNCSKMNVKQKKRCCSAIRKAAERQLGHEEYLPWVWNHRMHLKDRGRPNPTQILSLRVTVVLVVATLRHSLIKPCREAKAIEIRGIETSLHPRTERVARAGRTLKKGESRLEPCRTTGSTASYMRVR